MEKHWGVIERGVVASCWHGGIMLDLPAVYESLEGLTKSLEKTHSGGPESRRRKLRYSGGLSGNHGIG